MPVTLRTLTRARARKRRKVPFSFGPFVLGLNTRQKPNELDLKEMSACVNFKLDQESGLTTRPGLTRHTTSALDNPASFFCHYPRAGSAVGEFGIYTDTDDVVWKDWSDVQWVRDYPESIEANELIITKDDHKLYYVSGTGAPQLIGTLQGQGMLIPFGNYVIVLDGSYIKTWNGDALAIAYDDGTGSRGYQFNNTGLDDDTHIKLYSGGNVKAGTLFTTQHWDNDYTIPVTQIDAYLKKVGSPTGDITATITNTSGVVQATASTTLDASSLDTTAEKISFTFTSPCYFTQDTQYWAIINYSGGDGSNYVRLECYNVGSNGLVKYNDGSWQSDTAKDALMAVKPGRPPRGRFGVVKENRLFIAGDPGRPGVVWYCNAGDMFDWSTSNGGGYVGAVDSNASNFPVGALAPKYGDLYVFGKKNQPYICRLTTGSPNTWTLPVHFQRGYATWKTIQDVVNDLWYANHGGVDAMSGVEQYGDLRAFSESDPIQDKIVDYWDDDDAFSGYNPEDGQYLLQLPSYPRTLVANTKQPTRTKKGRVRYPWMEYAFTLTNFSSSSYKWTQSAWFFSYIGQISVYDNSPYSSSYYGLTFSSDGLTMYHCSWSHVYVYTLSVAWDITTATYSATYSTYESSTHGITFSTDGTKFYEINNFSPDKIHQYDLTTAWDLSTASHTQSLAAQDLVPQALCFSADGTKLYETGSSGDKIYESTLTTAWDISTASLTAQIASQDAYPCGLAISSDGKALFELGTNATPTIYRYTLSTAWDLSTASYVSSRAARDTTTTIDIFLSPDDSKLYELAFNDKKVYEYNVLQTVFYLQTAAGADPSISEPEHLLLDDAILTEGSITTLNDHEWTYGDADSLGYDTVYVRDDSGDPDTTGVSITNILVPTAFATHDNTFFVAGSDGYIYKFDHDVVDDNSQPVRYVLGTALLKSIFQDLNLLEYDLDVSEKESSQTLTLEIYDKSVEIDELDTETADASFSVDIDTRTDGIIEMAVRQFMAYLREVEPTTVPFRVHQINILGSSLSKT